VPKTTKLSGISIKIDQKLIGKTDPRNKKKSVRIVFIKINLNSFFILDFKNKKTEKTKLKNQTKKLKLYTIKLNRTTHFSFKKLKIS
jgi:hypothetical protein